MRLPVPPVLALAVVMLTALAAASDELPVSRSFAGPSPNLAFQLQKQNRGHPWLLTTTDSGRLTLKVRRIDELGLHGLTAADGAPPPEMIAWGRIARIDQKLSHATLGAVVGTITFGVAGASIGAMIGNSSGDAGNDAALGSVVLGSIGAWKGSRFGARFTHERNWYVADNTLMVATEVPLVAATPAPAPMPATAASPAVMRVANRIGQKDVIRVVGRFGQFQGYADEAGPQGLAGLHTDSRARGIWAQSAPPGLLPWEAIDRVHMRGGTALYGAASGAMAFALFGALLGAAAFAVANGEGGPGAAALWGAGVFAPVGAGFGAGVGALARRWVLVYPKD